MALGEGIDPEDSDDLEFGQANGLPVVHGVGLDGHFVDAVEPVKGLFFKAADKIIENLGDLLRASLRTTTTDEVPLATELDGLFLCGAATLGHGVAGASISGMVAASVLVPLFVPVSAEDSSNR